MRSAVIAARTGCVMVPLSHGRHTPTQSTPRTRGCVLLSIQRTGRARLEVCEWRMRQVLSGIFVRISVSRPSASMTRSLSFA